MNSGELETTLGFCLLSKDSPLFEDHHKFIKATGVHGPVNRTVDRVFGPNRPLQSYNFLDRAGSKNPPRPDQFDRSGFDRSNRSDINEQKLN